MKIIPRHPIESAVMSTFRGTREKYAGYVNTAEIS
jgi:hypothetical protein